MEILQSNGGQVSFLQSLVFKTFNYQSTKPLTISENKTVAENQVENIAKASQDNLVADKVEYPQTYSDNKPQLDISAVKLDLNLAFSAENLKENITNILGKEKQLPKNIENGNYDKDKENNKNFPSFINVDLSVQAERVQKTPVSGGNGKVKGVDVYYRKSSIREKNAFYNLEQIKLQVQRRRQEAVEKELNVRYLNGYRIVRQRISMKYQEDLSIRAELLNKFDSVTTKVAKQEPESTEKFLDTTNKLVQNEKVSGETVSKFFDVVESYVEKTRNTLHKKIDKFLDKISNDFNVDKEKLNEMRINLHTKVDTFFDNVNNMVDKLEGETLKILGENKSANITENDKSSEEITLQEKEITQVE
jgi:hypothetical protein